MFIYVDAKKSYIIRVSTLVIYNNKLKMKIFFSTNNVIRNLAFDTISVQIAGIKICNRNK